MSTTHISRRISCCIDYTFIYTSLTPFNYYSLKHMYEELCISQLSMNYSFYIYIYIYIYRYISEVSYINKVKKKRDESSHSQLYIYNYSLCIFLIKKTLQTLHWLSHKNIILHVFSLVLSVKEPRSKRSFSELHQLRRLRETKQKNVMLYKLHLHLHFTYAIQLL
jgi:hypothetical protein